MDVVYVLVHSPSVGPLTWAPVAARLPGSVVPSLLEVADAGPPFWPTVTRLVGEALAGISPEAPVVLVAHSNAGLFVPLILETAERPIAGCVFVDAALPARSGPTPVAAPELVDFLRPKLTGGRLPRWTDWWDESDVAPMFPDEETRRTVSAEQPRLPLSYYEQQIPVPDGWDDVPCSYLLFGPPYDVVAQDARERGWAIEHVPGLHLHQLVDPDAVTASIAAF
jgi:hypothetical protein